MVNYYLLMKPKIIMGNLITFVAGFFLASKGVFNVALFLEALIGLGFIIASACIFNNYIDRFRDTQMNRTKNRALATGKIKVRDAILLAIALGLVGNWILWHFTNPLTLFVANIGFAVYVLLYTLLKSKTTHSILIGSISGAIPPVVGYCAVSNRLDLAAAILFFLLVFWQMPHFFSIALWHQEDYKKAGIPLPPVDQAKSQMVLYILAFILTISLLTCFGYTGKVFLGITLLFSFTWLLSSFKGLKVENNSRWGKEMFRLSLLTINALCFTLPFDLV